MTAKQKPLTKLQWDQLEQNVQTSSLLSTFPIPQSTTDGQPQLDNSGNLVPIHLRRLNSSSSLNLDVGVSGESPKSISVTKSKSARSNSSWWSVDDLSYPGIPFQVARYLCETSPELLDSMAATLHDTGGVKQTQRTHSKISSPLLHLTSTTDALSLQESVIDGGRRNSANVIIPRGVTPSTPDENVPDTHSDATFHSAATTANIYEEHRRISSNMGAATETKRSWLNEGVIKEVGTNASYGPSSDEVVGESSRGSQLELKSLASDLGSNYELDSTYELQSNISETSGFEEEMFRIKKLLLESPRILNGEDSAHLQLDLLREKAALEGRVEALAMELNHVMNERTQLSSELNSTKSQLQAQLNIASRSYQSEIVNDLNNTIEADESKIRELEEFVSKLQTQLDTNSEEVIQVRAELKESEEEAAQLKSTLGELKVEAELKEGAVRGLKSKVAELHVKLESAVQSKSIIEGDLHASKAQVSTEQEMKDWYRTQLQQTQATKSKMQQELIALSSSLAESEAAVERMRFERDQCKRNLAETQRKAVTDKESLLRHLESIEADVRERENIFKELQRDASTVDEVVLNGVKKLEDERALLAEEKFAGSELRRQLEMAQLDSEMRLATVRKMETEAAQFMKQLTVLQKTVSEKELELHQSQERYNELEATQREQQAALIAKGEVINKLKQEKVALEVTLSGAREEKREMDSVISEVKDNVIKIESRTRNMREELNIKNEIVSRLEKENLEVKEEFRKLLDAEEKTKSKLHQVENEYFNAQEELSTRRAKEPRLQEAINRLSDQLTQLQGENALLKDKISILEKYNINNVNNVSVDASGENESKLKEELRLKENELAKLIDSQKEIVKKSQRFESNVKVLTRKLRDTLKTKTNLEDELKQLKATTNGDTLAVNASKTKDAKIIYYRKKLVAMETKLNDSLQLYEEERRRADKNQESLLDLERQKGKLHALADSTSALKQQTNHLEATLSVTEETVSHLHQLNNEIVVKKQQEETLLRSTLKDLQNKLKLEQDAVKEARKLMYKEKCESNSLRKHLTSTRASLEETNRMLEARQTQMTEIQTEVERQRLMISQGVSEASDLRSRLAKYQELVEKLQKEVEENRAKDPLLADQIKTLGWHLQQKKQEVAHLQQQLRVSEERQAEEFNRLNDALNGTRRELEVVKGELNVTVKEKLALQGKVTELRTAIKSILEKNRAQQQMPGMRIPESPSPCDENLISSLLQQSLALPECRPLSNLQVCVNTLKQEMAILQQQLLDQTNGAV